MIAETYSERSYRLWVKRLAEAEAEVERGEVKLSRLLGRLLTAKKRARTYRRKLAAAEESVLQGTATVQPPPPLDECEKCGGSFTNPCDDCIAKDRREEELG